MNRTDKALDKIEDRFIEEAANAKSLTKKSRAWVALPVAAAAAVGIFFAVQGGNGGVDLLPANSGENAAGETAENTTIYPDNNGAALTDSSAATAEAVGTDNSGFPQVIPLKLRSQEEIESIVFGSEFPDMIFADSEKAVFTEGVGGVYVYDFEQRITTAAVDVFGSIEAVVEGFPEGFGAESWNGASFMAAGDGTPIVSLMTAEDFRTADTNASAYYQIDLEKNELQLIENFELKDYNIYSGLEKIGADDPNSGYVFSDRKAVTKDGDYVYLCNSVAENYGQPQYDMQYIAIYRFIKQDESSYSIHCYPFGRGATHWFQPHYKVPENWLPVMTTAEVLDSFDSIFADMSGKSTAEQIQTLLHRNVFCFNTWAGSRTFVAGGRLNEPDFPNVPVFSDYFSSLEELSAIAHSTYTTEDADRLMNGSDRAGALFYEENGELMADMSKSIIWSSPPFEQTGYVEVIEETEEQCVFVWHYLDPEYFDENGKETDYTYYHHRTITYSASKQDGEWRLDGLLLNNPEISIE